MLRRVVVGVGVEVAERRLVSGELRCVPSSQLDPNLMRPKGKTRHHRRTFHSSAISMMASKTAAARAKPTSTTRSVSASIGLAAATPAAAVGVASPSSASSVMTSASHGATQASLAAASVLSLRSVPLAYRRVLIGGSGEIWRDGMEATLKEGEHQDEPWPDDATAWKPSPSPVTASPTPGSAHLTPIRHTCLFLHCLLGDSRQFIHLENGLHKQLQQRNHRAIREGRSPILLECWMVDARNHGSSPHASDHSYLDLVADVRTFIQRHGLKSPILCGHSQGGKTALVYALLATQKTFLDGMTEKVVNEHDSQEAASNASPAATSSPAPVQATSSPLIPSRLIIFDASPAAYTHTHSQIFSAMESIDLTGAPRKIDIERMLKPYLSSPSDRAFVLANIRQETKEAANGGSDDKNVATVTNVPSKGVNGTPSTSSPSASSSSAPSFSWRCNLPLLHQSEPLVHGWPLPAPPSCSYRSPALFLAGSKSSRLTTPDYLKHLHAYYPHHQLQQIDGAHHFLHQSHSKECAERIVEFLDAQ